jgi:hypothetical protein
LREGTGVLLLRRDCRGKRRGGRFVVRR